MKKIFILYLLVIFIIGCATNENLQRSENENMKLTSQDFKNQEIIPSKFTCDDKDINPELSWNNVPEDVKSFALIVDDPDAPSKTWVHWILIDIPKNVRKIEQNSIAGEQLKNDFGKLNYGGPCPPSGIHRYFFKLYALNAEKLENADEKNVYDLIEKHKIDEAVLIGRYERN